MPGDIIVTVAKIGLDVIKAAAKDKGIEGAGTERRNWKTVLE